VGSRVWAGVDVGKRHHHCVVIDADGRRLLSRRVTNDEQDLLALLADVTALADEVVWAVDLVNGNVALLAAVLFAQHQQVLYITGAAVNRAAGGYRGEGKTDAKDAAIIADQARMRRDLSPLRRRDGVVAELGVLTARRADLVSDRTRSVSRLREALTAIFPALERVLEPTRRGPLVLLSGYQTPTVIRRTGRTRLEAWLRRRGVRGAAALAASAVAAADQQHAVLPAETLTAQVVAALAAEVMTFNDKIAELDALLETTFRAHPLAEVIVSLPGIGPLLGAELLVATGGDMTQFGDADRLAGFAGLAPAPRDSGRVSGNLRRPKRYHRGLQRVFYTSALISIRWCSESRRFYDRKRVEGKHHVQAVLALARRRVNVLWALVRDRRCYQPAPPPGRVIAAA
jgi:transposase